MIGRLRCWLGWHDDHVVKGYAGRSTEQLETLLLEHVVGRESVNLSSEVDYVMCFRCGRRVGYQARTSPLPLGVIT